MEHRVPYIGGIKLTWLDYLNLGMGVFLLAQAGWHVSLGEPVSYFFSAVLAVAGVLVWVGTIGLGRHKLTMEQWFEEQREALKKLEEDWSESQAVEDSSSQK